MKSVLVVYFSANGHTEKMAEYIAEGVRISGNRAVLKKASEAKEPDVIEEFDGLLFGCPTYNRDIPAPMKKFLGIAMLADVDGKMGGAFGSYTHDGNAPVLLLDIMTGDMKMEPFELGAFNLKEDVLETTEGLKACHDYGKVFGESL
ncbi:MAG: flavodoxin domain-containing protein [Dehalococcoidaceae bacterium]|nr:flavodoxin domain-containing protein [Dehalococcoidaceae bacterium]